MTDNYAAVRDNDELDGLVERIIATGLPFGFDIESGFLGPEDKNFKKLATVHQHPRWMFVGFSVAAVTKPEAEREEDRIEWARYVPIAHDDGGNIPDTQRAIRALWRLLSTGLGVAHNLQFEKHGCARVFREVLWDDNFFSNAVRKTDGYYPALSDSLVEIALTAEYPPAGIAYDVAKGPTGYGLKDMTKRVFRHTMTNFDDLWSPEEIAKKVPKAFNNRDSSKPQVIAYACEDAKWCLAHHLKHYPIVSKMEIFQWEIDLIDVLCRMERTALLLDWDLIQTKSEEAKTFGEMLNEEIQQDLSERLGRTVNVNLGSAPQLAKILFEELGLPVVNRTKTGAASTDATSLAAISKRDPTVKRILQSREVAKLRNSYLDRYLKQLRYLDNDRAVPNHNQLGAITGRFSVDGASYQQWPKPYHYKLNGGQEFHFNFRDTLLSPEDFRIVGYDFSQVELRMLAGLAGEQSLIDSFLAGEDVHVRTASQMLGIPVEQVTKAQRAVGKTLNFAIVYGAGPARIANMLTTPENPMTVKDAKALLAAYFRAFPKIKAWLQETRKNAFQDRPSIVTTTFGRKVRIWEYQSNVEDKMRYNRNLTRKEAEDAVKGIHSAGDRLATNAPPQGGAADYMKIGMVRAQRAIDEAGLSEKVLMVMTVHDALEFYVHKSVTTQEVLDLIGPAVTFDHTVFPEILDGYPPIKADWHEGTTWGGVFEIDVSDDGTVGIYSYEDDDKVKHYYADFADALAGKEIEKPETSRSGIVFEFQQVRNADYFYSFGEKMWEAPRELPARLVKKYRDRLQKSGVAVTLRKAER